MPSGIRTNCERVHVTLSAPSVTAQASAQQQWETNTSTQLRQFNASLVAQVTVPIYQGGQEYSLVRQSKETLGR